MDFVDQFIFSIEDILDRRPAPEELQRVVVRSVSALVGRAGVTDDGFAPPQSVATILREARARVAGRTGDASVKSVVLIELDKALAVVGRTNLPPPSLL